MRSDTGTSPTPSQPTQVRNTSSGSGSGSSTYPDDKIDSDPIGGILAPAVVAVALPELAEAALGSAVRSGIRNLVDSEIDTATADTITPNPTTTDSATPSLAADGTVGEDVKQSSDWTLGNFKSNTTWANQMADRGWTNEDITNVINTGEQFPAPNKVNPENTATRYQDSTTGRFVVKDDINNEILQISGNNFQPLRMPPTK